MVLGFVLVGSAGCRSPTFVFVDLVGKRAVEAVLDVVIGATLEQRGDLGPLVPPALVFVDDELVFFRGPVSLLQTRVQMVLPSFARLLAGAPGDVRGDVRPALRTVLLDQLR